MFFLIGFAWHVAASFAFLLAILTPNWLSFQTSPSSGNATVQRGIFYVCDFSSKSSIEQTTSCVSIIDLDSTINSKSRWNYNLAIASASIAIGCAGLSIVVLWLLGIYFNIKKKTKCTSCFLIIKILLILATFSASVAVWILLIAETLSLGYKVDRSIFNWPMWLAVGASGGFLMGFITMLFSFCASLCRQRKRDKSLYYSQNQY